jgi:hypothetical protein
VGIRRWLHKRRVEKQVQFFMDYIQQQLESGVHPDDLLVYEVSKPVEWDVPLQCWKISFILELSVGELVYLESGRGGAKEHARVVDALGDGWYSVRFDVDNRLLDLDVDVNGKE